ncbi:MAG TPA: glycosyltransferase family A protein, partial [Bacteroidia bacterium]|nr:glycosyltransferase family A protein [Bacteroidia bacterium]
LQQTYSDWECLLIDDGSTDNTKEVGESYSRKDSRFSYYYQNNAGPSAARNTGIKKAKGDFLQFIDSDDFIQKEKLKRQIDVFKEFPSCDLVYGDMKYFSRNQNGQIEIRENKEKYWKNGRVNGQGDEILQVLLHGNIMVVQSPLIRKKVFEKIGLWDEQIWFNEDWDVWVRCAFKGLVFRFDNTEDTYSLVREHEDSRSRELFKMFLHGLKACLKIDKMVKLHKYKKIIKPKIVEHIRFLDNNALEKYNKENKMAIQQADDLFQETGLFHYRVFAWLMHHAPYYFCRIYSRLVYLCNRIKCKLLYGS